MTGVTPSGAISRKSRRRSHGLLLDQTRLDPHFPEDEADEAGMGTEWMMVERYHSDPGLRQAERERRTAYQTSPSDPFKCCEPG